MRLILSGCINIIMQKKGSDSDYKAEDEGSANEAKKQKPSKRAGGVRLNKKQMIDTAIKTFLPEGITLSKMQPLTTQQYEGLLELKDAEQFTLNFKTFLGKVAKVIDGDTIKAIVSLNNTPTKFVFRIGGVDTPQTRKGQAKEFGKKVKEVIISMIEGKMVKIEAGDFDKYGRILARIYTFSEGKQLCLNNFLLQHEMAKSYEGKTKSEFTSEDEAQFLKQFKFKHWPKTTNYPKENY